MTHLKVLHDLLDAKDEGITVLRNAANNSPNDRAAHCRRLDSSTASVYRAHKIQPCGITGMFSTITGGAGEALRKVQKIALATT